MVDAADATVMIEQTFREIEPVLNGPDQHDQIRADAINAVLRAKGVPDNLLLTSYEAAKVFTILSHTEELSGYSS